MLDLRVAATGIFALTVHSTKKLLFSRRIVITILVAAFVALVMGYGATQDLDPLEGGVDLMDVLILFFFMPVMAMIYGSSLIRDEIDDKSITHVATAPLDRVYAYLGYYVPLVIAVIVTMLVIELAGFLAFFGQLGITGEALEVFVEFAALLVLGSIAYSSLFLAVSVIFKKPVFFGLFYAFIWEGLIGSLPGVIQKASVKHYLRSIGSEWVDYGGMSGFSEASAYGASIAVILLVTLAFLVIGALLFREKELV